MRSREDSVVHQQRAIKFIFTMLLAVAMLSGALLTSLPALAAEGALTVGAASSLGYALKEVAAEFEAAGGARVRFSLGSSGALATQIENGAPFDLFLAADKTYAARLVEAGMIERGSVVQFAKGRLVIVVNRASGHRVEGVESLGPLMAEGVRLAIASPAHAPYGKAAANVLKKAGVWEGVALRVVYGENVRQALQFVQSGNAPLGIVAESLTVGIDARVSIVKVPSEYYATIEHVAGIVASSPNRDTAGAFIRFLMSPEARTILTRYGFSVPVRHD
ncbi:MAG: molybdate ABC transporter substrate-binding protein [Proteobacteria bacterium]|nr:molybdate ABC transporter substrate-binding protein [Pseudomonadota bacterium]